jgi:hypothetical protein
MVIGYEAVPCGLCVLFWYGDRLYRGRETADCDFVIVCTVVPLPVPVLVAQISWMHVEKQLKMIQLACLFECTVPAVTWVLLVIYITPVVFIFSFSTVKF